MNNWDDLTGHFSQEDRDWIELEKGKLRTKMEGKKPQDNPQWFRMSPENQDGYACSVWCRDVEIDMYVVRRNHRWGWYAERNGSRLAGSMAARYSYEDDAFVDALVWLEDQREGY